MSIPNQMLAMQASQPGAPAVLKPVGVPVPRPGPGQVLVRVEATSVNFSDVKRRRGDVYPFATAWPYTPGGEIAGTVAACGEGVQGLLPGQPVFGLAGGDGRGGYAQFALAVAAQLNPIPPGLDAARASALVIAGGTAMLLLRDAARLAAGETVLIPGAAGGVGHYAVQIARKRGARLVVAAASSRARADAALALGAHVVVDDSQPGWADEVRRATDGAGVDVLLESAGGPVLAQGLRALGPFGRAVVYGAASGQAAVLAEADIEHLLYAPAMNQSLAAFNLGGWFMHRPQAAGAALGELIGAVLGGRISVPPITTLPLTQAAEAHQRLQARQAIGKIVLDPWA